MAIPTQKRETVILKPLEQVDRQILLTIALILLLIQILIVLINMRGKVQSLEGFNFALGISFIGLALVYAFKTDRFAEIDAEQKTVTFIQRRISSTKRTVYSFDQVTLGIDEILVADPTGELSSRKMVLVLIAGEDQIHLDHDVEYIQWPIFLEKRAIHLSKSIGIPLTYITPKPEKLLS